MSRKRDRQKIAGEAARAIAPDVFERDAGRDLFPYYFRGCFRAPTLKGRVVASRTSCIDRSDRIEK